MMESDQQTGKWVASRARANEPTFVQHLGKASVGFGPEKERKAETWLGVDYSSLHRFSVNWHTWPWRSSSLCHVSTQILFSIWRMPPPSGGTLTWPCNLRLGRGGGLVPWGELMYVAFALLKPFTLLSCDKVYGTWKGGNIHPLASGLDRSAFSVTQDLHLEVTEGMRASTRLCLKCLYWKRSKLVKRLGYTGLLLRRRSGLLSCSWNHGVGQGHPGGVYQRGTSKPHSQMEEEEPLKETGKDWSTGQKRT